MAEVAQQKDKKSTRKVIIILLIIITIIIILLLLMRCGSSKKELKPVEEQKEEQTVEVVEKKSTGFVDVADKTITPELKELFDKATSKDTNIKYELIELIAKQENEDSIDYKFLAQEATTDDPDNRHKFIIIVHEDFGGDVSLTEVEAVVEPDEEGPNKKTIVVDDGKATTTYYLVIFRDQYGNELQRTALPYGATPSYNGWLPEGFQHWDKEISPVTGNVNYYAVCYEVHHSEPSDEPVTPVTPVDAGFYTNSLYSQTYTGGNIIDAVFTTYEDTNPSSVFNGYKIALLSMGAPAPVEQDAPVFRSAGYTRQYIRCAYEVDTSSTPKTITIYTHPNKKPEEQEAGERFTIEIGDKLTLKNFPTDENNIEFNQPEAGLTNFFSVDQSAGYAYVGNSMVWLLKKADNIEINGTSNITKIGRIGRGGEYFTRYNDSTKQLTIGSQITEIGISAFQNNTILESVYFSNATSLTTIGDSAFNGCIKITTITLPQSLQVIKGKAFGGCTELANLTLNEGLVTIGAEAFANCERLSAIAIPSTVRTVGFEAFINVQNLTSITFNGTPTIRTIEQFAFNDKNGSVSLTIPSSVEKLGLKCFYQFDPSKITLAEGFKTNWILYGKDNNKIKEYDLTDTSQKEDFLKGITGTSGFSETFQDDSLGYFEIKHSMGPVS